MSDDKKLIEEISKLKKSRNAIILVHNYQLPEVQDIADFTGDSLGLSREAAKTDAKVIVFCGVNFMAETAAIISPGKKVIVPEINAGCPMADMINVEKLKELKKHLTEQEISVLKEIAEIKRKDNPVWGVG